MGPRYHQDKRPPEQWRQTVYYEERPTTEFSAQLGNPMPIPHASEDNGEFYITVPADQKVAKGFARMLHHKNRKTLARGT